MEILIIIIVIGIIVYFAAKTGRQSQYGSSLMDIPIIGNTWNNIVEWFQDRSERSNLVKSFNYSAKNAFISGIAPTLLKAEISKGDKSYKHQFSYWGNTGIRIKAFSGKALGRDEIKQIGKVILDDSTLVRKLVVLGWDTLEIHGDVGSYGCKWQLKDYILLSNEYQ